jgi:diguanylate cyclase (GGDEF)-like protein/PAS domain S-box-containing protein
MNRTKELVVGMDTGRRPLEVVLKLALVVLATEFALMALIDGILQPVFQQDVPSVIWSLFDATLLTIIVAPALYVFVFRPIQAQQLELQRQADALNEATKLSELTKQLEAEIAERKQAEEHLRKLSRVVEQSPASVMITDLQGKIEYVNPKFLELSGYGTDELIGATPRVVQSGQTAPETYRQMWATISSGRDWRGELLNRKKNGELYWEDEVISPITDADGSITNFVAVKEDITQRKRAQDELLRLNRTLRMLSACNQALVRAKDEKELLDTICCRMVELGGYLGVWVGYAEHDEGRTVRPVTLAGMPDGEFTVAVTQVSWADDDTGRCPTGSAIRTGQVAVAHDLRTNPCCSRWQDAAIKSELSAAVALPLKADDEVIGAISIYARVVGAFDDREIALLQELADDLAYGIKVLREAVVRRRMEHELLLGRHAVDSSNDGIMITDSSLPDRPLIYVNPAFERITGYTAAEALGRNARFLLGDDMEQIGMEELRCALREQRTAKVVLRNYRKDGTLFWNELSLAPVHGESSQVRHFVSIINDITERKSYESQLEYQAGHDALTGLANRNLLADRLEQAIARAKRTKTMVAVLLLDLDRFKLVNDGLGHDVGDALLEIVSQRLVASVRSVDTVARLGGDEFVVVMTELDSEHDAAPTARKLLKQVSLPATIAEREIVATASMGIALYPKDAEQSSALLRNADVAMYRAKELGRNSMQFYTPGLNATTLARLELDTALRRALERDEFVLYYQPKVELQRGQVTGAEALIRWQHPLLGMVSPGDFIPLAEETGLIEPIGEWVIEHAVAQIKAWQNEGLPDIRLAVNLSARQFQQENLARVVIQALRLHDVGAQYLELEVTESAVMQDPERTVASLRELKKIGVHLALDDFGTGYSSLNYLKRFPIDTLKIDQSFVRDITTDPDDAAIALTVISLAHSLRRRVVAEGVETEAQLSFLRRHRCDEIQGYYFSRPLPADAFTSLLRDGRSLTLDAPAETSESRTLLLVDDEPNILTALTRVLRRDGYRILTAPSAAAGLELLALNEVQVIVSDQRMPEMSGTEFLGRVKEMYPNTIRIVLSGYTELRSITDAINHGAIYKFLTKPWEDDLLRENIRQAFLHCETMSSHRST